jgi:hypothetical protein
MENQRMSIYDFPGQPPISTDAPERIANLLRKGWTLRPDPPEHNPATHSASWDGGQWVVSAIPVVVPESVPAHHLRRALRAFGMLASVTAYMSALPDDDEMRESWEYAPYFRRDALGIEAARVALGLTSAQVDALFVAAGAVVT